MEYTRKQEWEKATVKEERANEEGGFVKSGEDERGGNCRWETMEEFTHSPTCKRTCVLKSTGDNE